MKEKKGSPGLMEQIRSENIHASSPFDIKKLESMLIDLQSLKERLDKLQEDEKRKYSRRKLKDDGI